MSSYERLAASYDELTEDVDYQRRADFLERLFQRARLPVHTVLDLACGTGTMTWLLTARGYELIAVDGSEDMLAAAAAKTGPGIPPVFLHQSMPQLDLYGTVDAAICCLDSLNYLTNPRDVQRTFERLHLFIAPGGTLIFDVNTPEKFLRLDGQVYLDETEPARANTLVPLERSVPIVANQSAPLVRIMGILASVSTLFTLVGFPR